ncbi:GPP34 family phosphoprotein [Streptomyces sp. NPDC057363]|uniref:GPP34 family phosphoprotein n=1 Tax=Streptomyces sp. NPDC057363 TaxID=3346107 RepID=UPI0036310CFB
MNTARDLFAITLEVPSARPIAQGDVSLALAGAELLDLREAHAVRLDGDRVIPLGEHVHGTDALLAQAAEQLGTEPPYETVEDWLWRRGRGLAGAYADSLATQAAVDSHGGFLPRLLRRSGLTRSQEPPSASRPEATGRSLPDDPVLAALASTLGIGEGVSPEAVDTSATETADDVETILAVVSDALTELEAERQRRQIEQDAYDNVWRAT